jgi:hypothetical protein
MIASQEEFVDHDVAPSELSKNESRPAGFGVALDEKESRDTEKFSSVSLPLPRKNQVRDESDGTM